MKRKTKMLVRKNSRTMPLSKPPACVMGNSCQITNLAQQQDSNGLPQQGKTQATQTGYRSSTNNITSGVSAWMLCASCGAICAQAPGSTRWVSPPRVKLPSPFTK